MRQWITAVCTRCRFPHGVARVNTRFAGSPTHHAGS